MRPQLALALSIMSATALAQPPKPSVPPHLYGTYSSYKHVAESDDIIGMELVILPSSPQPLVVFQCAEGAPGEAVLAPIAVTKTELAFDIPKDNMCAGHYRLIPTKIGLRVTGGQAGTETLLARKKSYWTPRY